MARSVKEWIGKNDDHWPPADCQLRVIERSNGKCAQCGRTFGLKLRPQIDHVRRLKSSKLYPGENLNRESNLQALCKECHTIKSGQEKKEDAEIKRYERKQYGVNLAKERRKKPWPKRPKAPKIKTAWWTQSGDT